MYENNFLLPQWSESPQQPKYPQDSKDFGTVGWNETDGYINPWDDHKATIHDVPATVQVSVFTDEETLG